MRFLSVLAASLLILTSAPTSLARDVSSLASALPAGATIGAKQAVRSKPADFAIAYHAARWELGLVTSEKGRFVLTWHREISGPPVSLDSPAPEIFRLVSRNAGSRSETVYAFMLKRQSVTSAIAGTPSGHLRSPEPPVLHSNGFVVRAPDSTHVGNVAYRTAEVYVAGTPGYFLEKTVRQPDYAGADYPTPSAWVTNQHGDTILIRLEIADTAALRGTGVMNRKRLDPDAGMIFVWTSPVQESFWMENTLIPLSIAWLGSDGTIQEIQDMQPGTTDLHTPLEPYLYAIEANLNYFKTNGITVGERFHLLLKP
jgi:uncharacterized membrane protein (UPF0127 family)